MIEIGLNAVIVAVADPHPQVLTIAPGGQAGPPYALPFGPFDPTRHRTFEIGLREWVEEQTALKLGYVEQLYTFGDRGRHHIHSDEGPHVVSVGYLALARQTSRSDEALAQQHAQWRSWYDFFPWEDWRSGRPAMVTREILPALEHWMAAPVPAGSPPRAQSREDRVHQAFDIQDGSWDEEKVLDRCGQIPVCGVVRGQGFGRRDVQLRLDHAHVLRVLGGELVLDLQPELCVLVQLIL